MPAADPPMAAAPPGGPLNRPLMLLVAGAMFMEILDGTILSTATPAIGRSFKVPSADLSIAITGYLVTLAVLIPLSGWLADRWGSRTIFLTAVATFTVASALCSASQSLAELTMLRILQAVGGAMMVPVGRLVVLRSTEPAQLIRAIAFITWPALAAPVLAPLVGGLLTSYLSWRFIFLINVPLGVAAIALALRLIPQVRGERPTSFDWFGFAVSTVALAALTVASTTASIHSVNWLLTGGTGAVGLCFAVLGVRHLRRASAPLVDLGVFRVGTFRLSQATGSLYRIGLSAMPFLLPILFQDGFGWSAVKSGALVLTLFVGNLVIKPVTTPMLGRLGFRACILIATVVSVLTISLCAGLTPDTPLAVTAVLLVISGAARSLGLTAYTTITFADVTAAQRAAANTLSATTTQLSLGLGVALGALGLRLGSRWQIGPVAGWGVDGPFGSALLLVAGVMLITLIQPIRMSADAARHLTIGEAAGRDPNS